VIRFFRVYRKLFWFGVGFVAAISFWGSLAQPHDMREQVPVSSIPSNQLPYLCGYNSHPVKVVRTVGGGSGFDIYEVTCSDGVTQSASW